MPYAFYFDSSSCSGCKACQVACQDKNNLPLGMLWRRVYEVSGGQWTRTGEAWTSTVFAYNLSIACNHCVHPKCAGVCPVDAYEVRPDGVVLIDPQKCIGCGYCAWACPYDAPQMDRSGGSMTKCNLCCDNLDAGLPPACVAACPLRCLELVETDDPGINALGQVLWKISGAEHPFPLSKLSRTEPHMVIKPHPGVKLVGEGTTVSNREEITPTGPLATARAEIPLVIFTLLAQMAIGAFVTIFIIYSFLSNKLIAGQITLIPLLATGAAVIVALLVSFFHLGSPQNAWRALNHLRKSWLSREILFTTGFAGLWAILTGLRLVKFGNFSVWMILATVTAVSGLVAVYSMNRVYQLRSVPIWNTGRTLLEFTLSTLSLGCLLTGTLLPREAPAGVVVWIVQTCSVTFFASCLVSISRTNSDYKKLSKWRTRLLLTGLLGTMALFIWPSRIWIAGLYFIFIIALVEETIGRWLFYSRRNPGI